MPIPLLIWGAAALAAALIGAAAIAVNINNIKGRRFAILGTKMSGKTSLHRFLSEGVIPSEHIQTSEERIKDNFFKLKHLKLRIKSSTDIGGDLVYEQRWKALIERGDYICYLIKMDKLYNPNNSDYKATVIRHINMILRHMGDVKNTTPLYLIYTFCDLVEDYKSDGEKFVKNFLTKNLELYPPNTASFFGSLKDKGEAEKLCINLLGKISENN